jgi:hypothetical protein
MTPLPRRAAAGEGTAVGVEAVCDLLGASRSLTMAGGDPGPDDELWDCGTINASP